MRDWAGSGLAPKLWLGPNLKWELVDWFSGLRQAMRWQLLERRSQFLARFKFHVGRVRLDYWSVSPFKVGGIRSTLAQSQF